jgi:flagellar assembly protein FliH
VVAAMSLSKIYRGTEADGLQEFQFRSFGDPEQSSSRGTEGFRQTSAGESGKPATQARPAAGASAQELEQAYARGRQDGLQEAEGKLDSTTQTLAAALEEVSRLRESLARNSRQDMLRLVMAIAEQVIRRELKVDPKVVLTVLDEALKASVQADQYRIRVNPADLERVTAQKPLFLASMSGLKNLNIEGDDSISAGGCRIESDLGEVDATIESQLDSIQQVLNEALVDPS